MNQTKVDWAESTWNPVTGCKHGCPYCYAAVMAHRYAGNVRLNGERMEANIREYEGHRLYELSEPFLNETGKKVAYPADFAPTIHYYRFDALHHLKQSRRIFVCSMADLFGAWVPDEWILEVFRETQKYPQHKYIFLTKNPQRYEALAAHGLLPTGNNYWYGTTVTRERDEFFTSSRHKTFLSVEPLLEEISADGAEVMAARADWIILGPETGAHGGKVVPERKWFETITNAAFIADTPIFQKSKCAEVYGPGAELLQQYPFELVDKSLAPRVESKRYKRCIMTGEIRHMSELRTLVSRRGRDPDVKVEGYIRADRMDDFRRLLASGRPLENFLTEE